MLSAQSQINYEMFFLDHLYHFSELSFYLLLKDTNLKMIDEFVSPWDKMTHCYILKKEFLDKKKIIKNRLKPINALKKRIDLANRWLNKDKELNVKIKNYKNKIFLFGSGEYSQILMCYAPIFFQKIEAIVVTDKQGSREFNTPIYLVKDIVPNTGLIFLGVRKEIEKNIRNLLLKQGWNKKNIIST